jgi:hypothetical protein
MKTTKRLLIILLSVVAFLTCETDPLTGKTTLALVGDKELFAAAFDQYKEFIDESIVIDEEKFTVVKLEQKRDNAKSQLTTAKAQLAEAKKQKDPNEETKEKIKQLEDTILVLNDTIEKLEGYELKRGNEVIWIEGAITKASNPTERAKLLKDAAMVKRLGDNIRDAAIRWYNYKGESSYLTDYKWEYHLVFDNQVNAWCMPGGKIVVYTGILPVTGNEDALATVMGHEVAHALLNHGRQRVSLNFLTQLGMAAAGLTVALTGASQQTQALFLGALGIGSALGVALPFSRENESEADHYGLILMAIAGYDPEASVPFWERMGSDGLEFLSTHPNPSTRANDLRIKSIPEAKRKAAKLHLNTLNKEAIIRAKKIAAEVNNQ